MNQVEAVIFDWAGTTVDYGCFAPLKGFLDGFASAGVEITSEEARGPMGLLKIDHIRALTRLPRIREELERKRGRPVCEADVQAIYAVFEKTLLNNLEAYSALKPDVPEALAALRARGIRIGSTSGYTRAMMDRITQSAARQGYRPECCVCADEVSQGRPHPFMIWKNMDALGVSDPRHVVKVGDTVSDIREGLSAGVWTVGVVMGSSELGLTEEETAQMPSGLLNTRRREVRRRFYAAGADFIVEDLRELPAVIGQIELQLRRQEPHKLLTPGPLTTRRSVKLAQIADHCTWDEDYKAITRSVLTDLTKICASPDRFASVLLQGSGSYAVEAMLQTFCPDDEKLLIVENGAYGRRMAQQAALAGKNFSVLSFDLCRAIDPQQVRLRLEQEPDIGTVMFVHSETTSGVINPLRELAQMVKGSGRTVLVDAMSSFGAYETDLESWGIDALASSANKCLEGLPGLAFVIARKEFLEGESYSKSLCLDLCAQYRGLYPDGKFRFTSPTTILLALRQALDAYRMEGGREARFARYAENHEALMEGMTRLGFCSIVPEQWQSNIITTFALDDLDFDAMYDWLKQRGFVIYPGKVTDRPTFRIGTIGDVYPPDLRALCACLKEYLLDGKISGK